MTSEHFRSFRHTLRRFGTLRRGNGDHSVSLRAIPEHIQTVRGECGELREYSEHFGGFRSTSGLFGPLPVPSEQFGAVRRGVGGPSGLLKLLPDFSDDFGSIRNSSEGFGPLPVFSDYVGEVREGGWCYFRSSRSTSGLPGALRYTSEQIGGKSDHFRSVRATSGPL